MTVYEKINWSSKYKNIYEKVKSTNQQVSSVEAVVKEWLERAYNFFFGFLLYWIWFEGYWLCLELSPKRLNVKIIVRSPDVIENDLFIVRVFLCNFVLCFPVGVEHFAVVAKPNFAWGIRLSM